MNEFIWEFTADTVRRLAMNGKRLDGRKWDQYRGIKIETGVSKHADGSAYVELGKTKVVAGVKMEIGTPFSDTPDEGTIMVDMELLPHASPSFEPGPPDENAIEIARVVDRGIRHSEVLDFKKLCITEGEAVFLVYIDMRTLDYDGNIFDAANIAAVTALLTTRVPKVEEGKIVRGEYEGKLEVNGIPVMTTFAKIGRSIFVDPSIEEEKALDARFSFTSLESGEITGMQKGGGGAFTKEELSRIIDTGLEKAKEIRKIIRGVVNGKD